MPRWNSFESFLSEAQQQMSNGQRQSLVDELLSERSEWPWVEGRRATFIFSRLGVKSAAVNLDTIPEDPPFARMTNLDGTTLWYATLEFEIDDLLDYLLAVDDPMTPLASEPDVLGRVSRFWRTDPLNPHRMDTSQMNVSVLRMGAARPFPDWSKLARVARGKVYEHNLDSTQLGVSGRRLWVYTPPNYTASGMVYPLLIMHDGQWCVGPLQLPFIADALIKHGRLQPVVIAMIQSGSQDERTREYVSSDRHYAFLLTELLPFMQTHYRVDSTALGVGGVALGAVAAAHAALRNPAVFTNLVMISPPLGKGAQQAQLMQFKSRFDNAEVLPRRIFQSVGRYELRTRFIKPAQELAEVLYEKTATAYRFVEIGSGHGLVGFRSILPEALAHILPGDQMAGE
jgi:enterochelin esterase-like enzyme